MDYERIRQQLARGTVTGPDAPSPASQEVSSLADVDLGSAPEPTTRRKLRRAKHAASAADFAHQHVIRQLALLALFELDVTDHSYEDVVRRVIEDPFLSAGRHRGDPQDEPEFEAPPEALRDEARLEQGVRDLVYGVIRAAKEIDAAILEAAPAFPIDRIGTIERNVLRLGIYELEYVRGQPIREVVNGNVELGKRFGGDTTASFVNGVLRTISERIPPDGQ